MIDAKPKGGRNDRNEVANLKRLLAGVVDLSKPPPGLFCSGRLGAVEKLL
jgi:hypothetical protein